MYDSFLFEFLSVGVHRYHTFWSPHLDSIIELCEISWMDEILDSTIDDHQLKKSYSFVFPITSMDESLRKDSEYTVG